MTAQHLLHLLADFVRADPTLALILALACVVLVLSANEEH